MEKNRILDKLEKKDPIFRGVKVKIIDKVEMYDSLNNRYSIKIKKLYEINDFDGTKSTLEESETEMLDLNGIKEVRVSRVDSGESKGCLCCKTWKIIYNIFYVNDKNEETKVRHLDYPQTKREEDNCRIIQAEEEKRLGLI